MSPASASVTTSAARPSMTERAWRPEPPCDWLILTVSPVFFFQYSANDLLKSAYSSRVGSYDTLSRVTSAACATCAGAADEHRAGQREQQPAFPVRMFHLMIAPMLQ